MNTPMARILKLTVGTFAVVWAGRGGYLRILLGPGLLVLVVEFLRGQGALSPSGAALLGTLYIFVYIEIAVSTHRLTLLGSGGEGSAMPKVGRREARFGWNLCLMLLVVAAVIFAASLVLVVPLILLQGGTPPEPGQGVIGLASWLLFGLACYVSARLSLIFPASAIDRPLTLMEAWRATGSHQSLMLFITLVLPLVLGLPTLLLGDPTSTWVRIALQVPRLITLTLVVTALSLTYAEIDRAGLIEAAKRSGK